VIRTGAGDDFIAAGAGTDYSIYGGSGSDIFSLSQGDMFIRIRDFEDGADTLHLGGELTFADLTIVDASRNGTARTNIYTDGVAVDQISAADFVTPDGTDQPMANTAPTLEVFGTEFFVENAQTAALTLTVADFDEADPGEALAVSVTGADAGAFTLVYNALGTYELFFASPPDFEAIGDANGDNIYDVTLTVTDPQGLFANQSLTVTVTDAPEEGTGPVGLLPTSYAMIIDGTEGRDRLVGSAQNDLIRAGADRDHITAGAGDDVIFAGLGPDYNVTGGTGADVFVFELGSAHLRILDFENGVDRIALDESLSVSDFTVVENSNGVALNYISQDGSRDRITLKDGGSEGLFASDIDAEDFLLVSAQELEALLLL